MRNMLIAETDKVLNQATLDFEFDFPALLPKKLISGIVFLAALLASLHFGAPKAWGAEPKPLDFIYVNGFGERRFPPAFETKMKGFLKDVGGDFRVSSFKWESLRIDLRKVVHQWTEAKKNADRDAVRFAEEVIKRQEAEKRPYLLVGYSLGTRVIAEALKQVEGELKYLRGIYFLGSALPRDYKLETKALPKSFRIVNYYSKGADTALKISFYNAEGIEAGGQTGFDDEANFMNLRTVSTHVHKGGIFQRDYSNLAEAIGYLSFYREGIIVKEGTSNMNIESKIYFGGYHWNDIYQFETGGKTFLIQQNANTGYYRALLLGEDGRRVRKAWGRNLHGVMEEVKVLSLKKAVRF